MQPQPLDWCDPLTLAHSIDTSPMVLYYSSAQTSYSGATSLLATGLVETQEFDSFDAIDTLLAKNKAPHGWFGYLSYEMRHDAENYHSAAKQGYGLPRARLMRFSHVYVFDHRARTLTLWSEQKAVLPALTPLAEMPPAPVISLTSNMTRAAYQAKVAQIVEEIGEGNLYQANLTRKFFGRWKQAPHGLSLFARLCAQSPAPYSAYLRMHDAEVLSSSPELFLKIDATGRVITRPIKGTAPRGKNQEEDARLRDALQSSAKDRAENLMITDLMRNDLARACIPGSVQVDELFDVTPHATIFHMASVVEGQRDRKQPISHLLRSTFPPGSMTGAPKIRAVELCNALEGMERGIYSGAIGWFGANGSAELSVVIRTLIVQGKQFEFQVGGGIIADSTPQGEWQETMDKALGILKTLGIDRIELESL